MPNRIIKESICASETINELSWFEECFFYRLIVNCDDFGRMDARPAMLKARLFPLKERISHKDIESALGKLAAAGCVKLYECDSKPYLQLPTWEVHQTIRAKKSKFPAPPSSMKASEIICKQLQADESKCSRNPIQSESESKSECENECVRMSPAEIVALFNKLCFALPNVSTLTNERVDNIRQCDELIKGAWQELFTKVKRSDFLTGKIKDWRADFDWIIEHPIKIMEGSFDNPIERNGRKLIENVDEITTEAILKFQNGI